MSPLIITIAAFVGVAALVGGVAMLMRNGSSQAENRLEVLAGIKSVSRDIIAQDKSILNTPLGDQPGFFEAFVSRFLNIRRLLDQADASITPSKFLLIVGCLAGVGLLGGFALRLPAYLVPLIALFLGVLPLLWLMFRRKRRLGAFAKQLPEALELVARALRAGHSLASGFNLVASEMSAPISREFAKVYEEQNLGIPLDEALEGMADRVPNLDLRFFATAVILQRQTGGDLAEILDKIGYLVRERFKIWGAVQALTGEGRLSGIVLLALPPALFGAIWRLNPDYVKVLFTDPLGKQMLAFGIFMQVLGALVIRKIVNIRV